MFAASNQRQRFVPKDLGVHAWATPPDADVQIDLRARKIAERNERVDPNDAQAGAGHLSLHGRSDAGKPGDLSGLCHRERQEPRRLGRVERTCVQRPLQLRDRVLEDGRELEGARGGDDPATFARDQRITEHAA